MNLNPKTNEAIDLFLQGTLALGRAEQYGLRIDTEYIIAKKAHLTRKIERLEQQFKDSPFFKHWQSKVEGEININSNTQLANYLYDIKGIKVKKETMSGKGSTDKDTLAEMHLPELDNLLEMRKLKKIRDTYLDPFLREQVNDVLHPNFNLHLVSSFRSSSSAPNVQNIPKRDEETMQIVRKAIYPKQGHQLLEVDFKGIEVAINCCYNKDSTLIKYVSDPKSDMHADMAKQIFVLDKFDKEKHYTLRQAAKNGFVFPEFYGDYFVNCAENMAHGWGKLPKGVWKAGQGIELDRKHLADHLISKGITSLKKFEKHLEKIEDNFWNVRFPEYAHWKDRWYSLYKKYGYVDLLTGFRCSGVMSKNEVINVPAQGTAFHCLLWCFIQLDKIMSETNCDTRLISQVHDSMLFSVNPKELVKIMELIKRVTTEDLPEHWKWIIVPLSVDFELAEVDKSWAEKVRV